MADSLLDFGHISQLAQQNLRNAIDMRHMDLYEQGLKTRDDQADISRRNADTARMNSQREMMDSLHKLTKDPTLVGMPQTRWNIYNNIAQLAGSPPINMQDIGASDAMREEYTRALRSGDKDAVTKGLIGWTLLGGPDGAKAVVDATKDLGALALDTQKAAQEQELKAGQIADMREHFARVNIQKPVLTLEASNLREGLLMTEDPLFKRGLALADKDASGKWKGGPEGRSIMKKFPQLEFGGMKTQLDNDEKSIAYYGGELANAEKQLRDDRSGIKLPEGVTRQNVNAKIDAYSVIVDAYKAMQEWHKDPMNSKKLEDARRLAKGVESARVKVETLEKNTDAERLKLQQDIFDAGRAKDEKKELLDRNVGRAQAYVLKKYGYEPTAEQLAEGASRFGVAPKDIEVGNPAKKGKVEVGIAKLGQEDFSRQYKMIEGAQSTIDYIDELHSAIKQNPSIVGATGQLRAATAGATQQLTSIFDRDPSASKFLNTKPRDNAEALYEVMVYSLAKTMDPSGALDLKVVEAARRTLGDMNSITTGPQQMLNKLDVVRTQAAKNIRRARQRIEDGTASYTKDQPTAPTPSDKPFHEMSMEELMREITEGSK